LDRPFVSVITNSYNSGKYLRANIESVLRQEYTNWEHIIVDCGSTDDSLDILAKLNHKRLRVIQIPFCGVASGRNLGIEKANGDIIAILDSDDYSLPQRLTEQVDILLTMPNVIGVSSGFTTIDEATNRKKRYIYPSDPQQIAILLLAGFNPIPHSSLSFRKSSFYAVGGYSDTIEKGEDFNLLLKFASIGDLFSLPKVLVQNTKSKDSHTFRHRPKGRDTSFYVVLSLILNSLRDEQKQLTQLDVEMWLESIAPDCLNGLLAEWALKSIHQNWRTLDVKSIVLLVKMGILNCSKNIKYCLAPWRKHSKTPNDIAVHLLSKRRLYSSHFSPQNLPLP
jgi:glycosyltransferase involved in cell wall biosynthesis